MESKNTFAPEAVLLSVVTAAVAECVLGGEASAARDTVIAGFFQALAVVLLAALISSALSRCGTGEKLWRAVLSLWMILELFQTLWQAQSLCWRQFSSMGVICAAPFLIWYGWRRRAGELTYTARVLWWLALCGAAVCALGLAGQTRWQRLIEEDVPLWSRGVPTASVYAEYFAAPLLCAERGRGARWLPAGGFIVRAGFCVGWGLVFGAEIRGRDGAELLRVMSAGAFSRLDSFSLLIWIILALYRVCFLCAAVRVLAAWDLSPSRAGDERC